MASLLSSSPPPSPQQGAKRKREPDEDAAKDSALQRMYKSEQWSDLAIETSTRTFRVHKAVVCEMNAFMKAACTRGFVESQTSRLRLPENEVVVEAILQSFYEMPITLLKRDDPADGPSQAVLQDRIMNLINLELARDKYDLGNELRRKIHDAFSITLCEITEPRRVVEVGCSLWDGIVDLPGFLASMARVRIGQRLQSIVDDTDAWNLLCQHPELLHKVLEFIHTGPRRGFYHWPCVKPEAT